MNLRKQSETAKTITLAWDPVPGADGYLFFADGKQVSRTFDTSRTSARFGKGPASFAVQAVAFTVVDQGAYPHTSPPPPPPPPPSVAPRTYNKVPSADARFCVTGLTRGADGLYHDAFSRYDENGLDFDGGRSKDTQVPGLKPADEMDGRGPCDPYGPFPPWPAGSYER
jgi:hypothetical protein